MNDSTGAIAHFERAVALNSTFETGYALAMEYLKQKQLDAAANIFSEMISGFGDSAEIHMDFGRAYGESGFAERAVPEFEKALREDSKIRGGPYSLGAAYLLGLGNVAEDKAAV